MGLFDKMKQKRADKKQAIEDNRVELDSFNPSKTLGIYDKDGCTVILVDEEKQQFVETHVAGELETSNWRKDNPWIIDLDQVEEAYLDVDQYWTEEFHHGKYDYIPRGTGTPDPNDWDELYWCYNIEFVVSTSHPYAKTIRFKINDRTLCTQVPRKHSIFGGNRRGMELSGNYGAQECRTESARLLELADEVAQTNKTTKTFDIFSGNRPDGILDRLIADGQDNYEVSQIKVASKILEIAADMIDYLQR